MFAAAETNWPNDGRPGPAARNVTALEPETDWPRYAPSVMFTVSPADAALSAAWTEPHACASEYGPGNALRVH